MGVGDVMTSGALPKVGGGGFGSGRASMSKTFSGFGGAAGSQVLPTLNKGMGGGIGASVQPMQSSAPGASYQPPGIDPNTGQYSSGGVQYTGGGATIGAATTAPPPAATTNGRDWYETVGASETPPQAKPAVPVITEPNFVNEPINNQFDPNLLAMLGLGANYQMESQYAISDNGLSQQMIELRKRLLGLDNSDVGYDQANVRLSQDSIRNRQGGLGRDSDYLRTQRGMYDQQLAQQLAQIDTRHQVDRLDHENQYVSGGAHFAPGQKYRRDRIDWSADQNRELARISTGMSQLGIDRSLNNNDTQMRDYDIDYEKLENDYNKLSNRLAANGINMEMYGLNSQQLNLALQKRLDDLGLSQFMSASQLLGAAGEGGGESSDYALQLIMDWLQGGGVGQIGQFG